MTAMSIDRRLSTTLIFTSAALMLVIYLLGVRYQVALSSVFFFLPIAVMVVTALYQVLGVAASPGFNKVVLIEIMAAALIFHFIYQIPTFSLYGSDSYFDLASLRAIMESGRVGGVDDYVQITSFFPMIHILAAQFSLVSGLDYFDTAKWLPSVLGVIGIPLIYLVVRFLFKKERAALLAALLYAVMQHHILFGSLFVRETIAIVLALGCVYFYVASRSAETPFAYRALALLCLAGTILAHHLTSVMLIVILLVYWVFTVFSHKPGPSLFPSLTGERVNLSIIIIAAVGTLTYWMINIDQPVQVLMFYVSNVLDPSTWGIRTILAQGEGGLSSLPSLRYYVLIYGSYAAYAVFGLVLIWRSLSKKRDGHLETRVFTVYLALCGVVGVMSYYLLPPTIGGDRFLTFGWLFAIGPVALAIIEFRSRFVKAMAVALVLAFAFINIYTIHPTLWDSRAPGAGGAAGREDFALAETVSFREEVIGYMTNIMTIYSVQNTLGMDTSLLVDSIDFDNFVWVIINRPGLHEEGIYTSFTRETMDKMTMLEAGDNPAYVRTYESNNLAVLKQR